MNLTCHDCEEPYWAPDDLSSEPHGWCREWYEWVTPAMEACHKVVPTEEAIARLAREAEEARWAKGDEECDRYIESKSEG